MDETVETILSILLKIQERWLRWSGIRINHLWWKKVQILCFKWTKIKQIQMNRKFGIPEIGQFYCFPLHLVCRVRIKRNPPEYHSVVTTNQTVRLVHQTRNCGTNAKRNAVFLASFHKKIQSGAECLLWWKRCTPKEPSWTTKTCKLQWQYKK